MRRIYIALCTLSLIGLFGTAGGSDTGALSFGEACLLTVLFAALAAVFGALAKRNKKMPGEAATSTEHTANISTTIIARQRRESQ